MTRSEPLGADEANDPNDLPLRVLTWGLGLILVAAPLPFGSVGPRSRLALELASFVLGIVWMLRGFTRPSVLPGRAVRIGLVGLLLLAAVQALPVGTGIVTAVSPGSAAVRSEMTPPPEVASDEADVLGIEPGDLDPRAALSVDPPATASALRTGAALALLLLAATTVSGAGRASTLVGALAISGALQALYGLAVLATGHDAIWTTPKLHYLDSATGTFVNRNHFAAFVGAALAAGAGLVLARLDRAGGGRGQASGLASRVDARAGVTVLLGLAALLSLSGLLLSLSRAGIACGVSMTIVAVLAGGARAMRRRSRVTLIVALLIVGAVPLARIGAERLAERYARAGEDLRADGGRLVVWADTLRIARAFPAVGAGVGAFAAAYPGVRSAEVRSHYTHAHNDAVQLIAEGGLVGAAFALALVVSIAAAALPSLLGRRGPLGAGMAAGLGAIALHAIIDFPFHIPATAALAAVLAGGLMGLACRQRV